ncbi:phosphate propanoyltransferase [uncultured Cetobacterium sp.]|uniref:phosphate propanoyltransferase n=1 Tax=uncultured Cetobacterium sp. TaxID=527638 RepID=UPI00345D2F0D
MELDKMVEIVKAKLLEINNEQKIPVEASGRHIHISKEDAEILFGKGCNLTKLKDLSQPGQYACEERVKLIGPKGIIEGVIVLGPFRNETQIELSITDARILGVKPILRESGNIENTPGIIVVYKDRCISLKKGVIIAKNHIHMDTLDSIKLNAKDKDLVDVQIKNSQRPIIFKDVLVRVNDNFKLNMHIDYDEANSCMLGKDSYGEIV